MFLVLLLAFGMYVYTEKQVDRANGLRYASFVLADQLRQSSDDLTRMARTYVATGDSRYRKYYQDILEIRDGNKPQPDGYLQIYWDLVLADKLASPTDRGQSIALLELMRQAEFPEEEMRKLAEAKMNSDALTAIEFAAMKLVEARGQEAPANRAKAIAMMHDAGYHQAKAAIMQPINAVYALMDQRTVASVHSAERIAIVFRMVFILCFLAAMGMLWRVYAGVCKTLGGGADEVHAQMLRLGRGDFSSSIAVEPEMENSVLAGLAEMQDKLHAHEIKQKQAEAELRVAAAAFESQEGMVITDANSKILRINRAFTEITGYTPEEIVGQTPRLLKSSRHSADFYREMWETLSRTGVWQGEIWDRRKSGEEYPKWLTISAVKDSSGAITHYVGAHYDITQRKMAEEKIQTLAFFDQLTNLPNRTLLQDRLKQAMAASSRSGSYGALLFIDLDNFKTLNDTLGHDMGDLLLKQVAQRLKLCVREGDTVARLGGDEFVVVLAGLSTDERDAANGIETVAEKILAALNQSYQLGDAAHHGSASIGVTLFRGDLASVDDLMKQADLAMYKSKEAGRNTLRFFDPDMESAVKMRAALEDDLRRALEEKQFLLYYQAQVVGEGRLTGVEALVRWQHPRRGMVPPADFISLAEETGLILPLGHWVLETSCSQLVAWARRPETANLTIAVNVSAHQFRQPDFVDQVLAVLDQTGANPQRLKLELTESLLVHDVEEIIEKMFALKAKGVGFSLDDFGTGYSSLSYLKRLPLDQLKIDQSFVRDVLSDPNDAAIAKTVVALGQSLGLNVIAEGVETETQRDFLAGAGCHAYQGYFFSRPLPIDSFEQFAQSLICNRV
ncbi:MAG: EAL domain-containing protein [Sterolibacterium sp.]|nr:EAL domain-containing protein [Sterolibacterium sp.]